MPQTLRARWVIPVEGPSIEGGVVTIHGGRIVAVGARPAGKVEGFHYSEGLAKADFTWDETKLDVWLTNPQAVIPGVVMAYRQAKAETRAAIITYLKELN